MPTPTETIASLRMDRWSGRAVLARRFGIDSRALAGFRIALGAVLLVDLVLRARHLTAFYTEPGVLPRAVLLELHPAARFSLHALSGAAIFQVALFATAGAAALALVVGYRARLGTVASLGLLVSLHLRNPFVLNGGDALLRRLLLWGVFLPLGGRWALDTRRPTPTGDRVATLATAGLLLQLVLVYTVTGLFKLRGTLWPSGRELAYLLRIDQLTVFPGELLAGSPAVLAGLTWLWLAMVLASGLLVVLTGWPRAALVGLFAAMHVGMALTLKLGVFPLVSLVALVPFVPPVVWDRLEARLSLGEPVPSRIRRRLSGLGPRLPGAPSAPSGWRPWACWLRVAAVGLLLVSLFAWNAMSLGVVATPEPVAEVRDPSAHAWDMFARGRRADGWLEAPGRLASGGQVDAFRGTTGPAVRPADPSATFPSARWLRFTSALRRHEAIQREVADFLCWRWNRRHDAELARVEVTYVKQPVWLDGRGPIERQELGQSRC